MSIRVPFQWLLLAVIVLGIFYPAIFGGVSPADDFRLLNHLANKESFDFFHLFFPKGGYYYRPIPGATFFLDQILWDGAPLIIHVENLFLHLFNASLVFLIARCLCPGKDRLPNWLPLLAAIGFALHPVNAEAVCWISGRYDLLATSFVLFSTWLLLRALEKKSWIILLLAILAALFGCLTKETALFFFGGAVLLTFVKLRIESFSKQGFFRGFIPWFLPWCAGALGYLWFRNMALSGRDTGINAVVHSANTQANLIDWLDQLRVAIKISGFYLKKIFFPYPLNFAIIEISDIYLAVGILFLLILIWLIRRFWFGDVSAAFFLASILTASAALLVVFGRMAWTPVAERYLYMPTAFFVLGWVAWASSGNLGLRKVRFFKTLAICFVILSSGLTIQRALLWSDPVALAEDTVAKSPNFAQGRKDLANYYFALGKIEEGKRLLEDTIKQTEGKGYVGDDLILVSQLTKEGQLEEAHRIMSKALKDPGKQFEEAAKAMIALNHKRIHEEGLPQVKFEIRSENITLFEKLRERRSDPFLDYQLAKEYLAIGKEDQAIRLFETAYHGAPQSAFYRDAARKLMDKLKAEMDD